MCLFTMREEFKMCIYLQQSFDRPEVVGDPMLVTGH